MTDITDLAHFIQTTPMVDTHEHLHKESDFVDRGPDILNSLFDWYIAADLISAGATAAAVKRLADQSDPDLRGRFAGIRAAWEAVQFTGYGEGVRWVAQNFFGMDEITADGIEAAAPAALAMHRPGERLRILRDVANLDHVQVDDFTVDVNVDASGPDFFRYDISWVNWANGRVRAADVHAHSGIEPTDTHTLRAAFEAVFARYGAQAVAVKTQHAYDRTLIWRARDEGEVEPTLQKSLRGETLNEADALCLGDWCLGVAAEIAAQHRLPIKIHTGYYAGNNRMPMDRIHASHLAPLLAAYPQTRFVLMHTAYPFGGEVVSLVKHYANTYADMCWAWSIDPHTSEAFVRQFLHAAPANKLFIFGGDTGWPHAAAAYAWQARGGLTRALQAEIDAGFLNEAQAISLAQRWMRDNAYACFDLDLRNEGNVPGF